MKRHTWNSDLKAICFRQKTVDRPSLKEEAMALQVVPGTEVVGFTGSGGPGNFNAGGGGSAPSLQRDQGAVALHVAFPGRD